MFIRTLLFASSLAFGASAFAQTPAAASNATRTYTFSSIGLGSTETAEINVSNIAIEPTTTSTTAAPAACTGSVSFVNAAGTTIGKSVTFSVTPGQTSSTPLPFSSAALNGVRGQVRGVVQVNSLVNGLIQGCSLAFSFETYDTVSGASHVVLTNTSTETNVFPAVQLGH